MPTDQLIMQDHIIRDEVGHGEVDLEVVDQYIVVAR